MSETYNYLDLHSQPQPEHTTKYFGLSVFFHVTLAVASLFVVVPAMENLKKEIITIELEPQKAAPEPLQIAPARPPQGVPAQATTGSQNSSLAKAHPTVSAPVHSQIADHTRGPINKAKKSTAQHTSAKAHSGRGHAQMAKASATPRAGVPETLEDISAEDLDFESVQVAQLGQLGEHDFDREFKKVDRSHLAALKAEKSALDREAELDADEKEQTLKALEDEAKANAQAMAEAQQATRLQNANLLAKTKAAERDAAEKAAAERVARETAMAAKAAATTQRNQGSGSSRQNGLGSGNNGANQAGQQAGSPNGVKSLDQVKQLPGNPKPQYSVEERLRREQGEVIFYAYVTSTGSPSQFKLVQPSGYRNLDEKTLSALKKWKFYPGQQGWVEIPFRWDLKGGVQEMPTLLRRFSSK